MKRMILCITLACVLLPAVVLAHQPRIVRDANVSIIDPEISRAYYDDLQGVPRMYVISSETGFTLYLNILVPKNTNPSARYSVNMYPAGDLTAPLVTLDGTSVLWKEYFDEFGRDWYFQGPELRRELSAGTYVISVSGNNNRGKYALVIGEKESFPPAEIYNTIRLLPTLKSWFFGRSPVSFAFTIFGAGYLLIMFALAFIAGSVFRMLAGRYFKNSVAQKVKNLGMRSRWLRAMLGLILLALGLYSWHPLILFLSGFLFFESMFGWCGLYACMAKSD